MSRRNKFFFYYIFPEVSFIFHVNCQKCELVMNLCFRNKNVQLGRIGREMFFDESGEWAPVNYHKSEKCLQTVHKLVTHWSQIVDKHSQPGHKLFTKCSQPAYKLPTNSLQIVYKLFTKYQQKNVLNFLQTGYKLVTNWLQTVHKMFTNSL